MNKICECCNLGLNRADCSEQEFKECLNKKYNNSYYSLFFIDDNKKERFYGCGDRKYMIELIEDYVSTCNMYGKESVIFKVERGLPYREDIMED